MRGRSRLHGRRAMSVGLAAVLAVLAMVPVLNAGAAPEAPVTLLSGPVGVTKDDVLRVNVTNLNTTTQQVQVTVVDEKGMPKGKTSLTVNGNGATGFFDLTLNGLVGRLEVRTQAKCANNLVLVSTEVYDALSVQTRILIPPAGTTSATMVEYGATAITKDQTGRLSVANLGSVTADVTMNFYDGDGIVLDTTKLSVLPRQTGFFDFADPEQDGRLVLRGQVVNASGASLLTSLEVFDTLTGRTQLNSGAKN